MARWNTVLKGGWTAVVIVDVKDFRTESCFNNNRAFWGYAVSTVDYTGVFILFLEN